MSGDTPVVPLCAAIGMQSLRALLEPLGLQLANVADGAPIPGSYWGDSEAGLVDGVLYLRADTPVHSALHEAAHHLCAQAAGRDAPQTDAGGSDTEENAVCYLQCVLADALAGYSRAQCFADMDAWGYTFVLGGAEAWFDGDADDARDWLLRHRPAGWE